MSLTDNKEGRVPPLCCRTGGKNGSNLHVFETASCLSQLLLEPTCAFSFERLNNSLLNTICIKLKYEAMSLLIRRVEHNFTTMYLFFRAFFL